VNPRPPGIRRLGRSLLPCAALLLGTACSAASPEAVNPPRVPTLVTTPVTGQAAARLVARPPHYARPAGSEVIPERPLRLRLPSGTVLPVDVSVSDAQGTLSLPDTVERAGWWGGSARLGDVYGAVVVAAHVDSFTEGIGPIAQLLSARPGDVLTLESRTLSRDYVVDSARLVPRAALGTLAPLLSFSGGHRLVVITCGGTYDRDRGGYHDNLVVVAEAQGPLRRR
jgi:hypothetical protein